MNFLGVTYDDDDHPDDLEQQRTEDVIVPEEPNMEEMLEQLSPEIRESLDNISTVDGESIEESLAENEDYLSIVDPDTGEEVNIADEMTMEDLGLIDPNTCRKYVAEAFYSFKLEALQAQLFDKYDELGTWRNRIERTGLISRDVANSLSEALGGTLANNVQMETFTQLPSKNKLSLALEELSTGQQAMIAGGAVVGAGLLYKLIRWFISVWKGNDVASGAMKSSQSNVIGRARRIWNAPDIQNKASAAASKSLELFAGDSQDGMQTDTFIKYLKSVGTDLTEDKAKEVYKRIIEATILKQMGQGVNNLWVGILTDGKVAWSGGSVDVNKQFFDTLATMVNASKELLNQLNNAIENIETTSADSEVNSTDGQVNDFTKAISNASRTLGYNGGSDDVVSFTNDLVNHVKNNILGRTASVDVGMKVNIERIELIDVSVFELVDEQTVKDAAKTLEKFNKLLGAKGAANQGSGKRLDSRTMAIKNISLGYRAAMNVMRLLLAIRDSLGRGLQIMDKVTKSAE